jgi:hypothetical protein
MKTLLLIFLLLQLDLFLYLDYIFLNKGILDEHYVEAQGSKTAPETSGRQTATGL